MLIFLKLETYKSNLTKYKATTTNKVFWNTVCYILNIQSLGNKYQVKIQQSIITVQRKHSWKLLVLMHLHWLSFHEHRAVFPAGYNHSLCKHGSLPRKLCYPVKNLHLATLTLLLAPRFKMGFPKAQDILKQHTMDFLLVLLGWRG